MSKLTKLLWFFLSVVLSQCRFASSELTNSGVPEPTSTAASETGIASTVTTATQEHDNFLTASSLFEGNIVFISEQNSNLEVFMLNLLKDELRQLTNTSARELSPTWSRDGQQIAYMSEEENSQSAEIYVMQADGSGVTRLTQNAVFDGSPTWSPDGRQIAFVSNRDGNTEIYTMDIAGGNIKQLTYDPGLDLSPEWSPDGARIAFASSRGGPGGGAAGIPTDLFVMNTDGSSITRLTDSFLAGDPAWSPDDQFIAFVSGIRDSRLFILNITTGGLSPLTSYEMYPAEGVVHRNPVWSPDGKFIAFTVITHETINIYAISTDLERERQLIPLITNNSSNSHPGWGK
jgi:tol-pal system beta propeller repeat protein TolB